MQATNRIRNKIKALQLTQILALTYSSTETYQVHITNNCANIFFCRLSSSIIGIVTPIP